MHGMLGKRRAYGITFEGMGNSVQLTLISGSQVRALVRPPRTFKKPIPYKAEQATPYAIYRGVTASAVFDQQR